MSLFRKLFRSSGTGAAPQELSLPGDGSFRLGIVGESNYQDALEAICGGRTEDGADLKITARLLLENTNPYDPDAVQVQIHGRTVGYLSRPDAREYRSFLRRKSVSNAVGVCQAHIRGGWQRRSDKGYFGVRLDFLLYG